MVKDLKKKKQYVQRLKHEELLDKRSSKFEI